MKKRYIKPLTVSVRVCTEPLMQLGSTNLNEIDLDGVREAEEGRLKDFYIGDDLDPNNPGYDYGYTKPNITDIWADDEW